MSFNSLVKINYNKTVQVEGCWQEEGGRAEGGAAEVLPRQFQGPRQVFVSRDVELLQTQLLLAEDEIIKAVLCDSAIDHL